MDPNKPKTPSALRKQIPRFIISGISAVACDTLVYFTIIHVFSHSTAKAISFLSGTALSYILNKHWTFEKKERNREEMVGFLILYLCTLAVNVAVNKLGLNLFLDLPYSIVIAFLVATGTSTVLNFIGQKWIIFKQ